MMIDTTEVLPNAPSWRFEPAIDETERNRLQDEIDRSTLKTVYDPEIPCDIYELAASSTRSTCRHEPARSAFR